MSEISSQATVSLATILANAIKKSMTSSNSSVDFNPTVGETIGIKVKPPTFSYKEYHFLKRTTVKQYFKRFARLLILS